MALYLKTKPDGEAKASCATALRRRAIRTKSQEVDNMSQHDIVKTQPWLQQIVARTEHVLLHQTDRERALSILRSGRLHGDIRWSGTSTEAYPHFTYEGWPLNRNKLPVRNEVILAFDCCLPARYRGEGPNVPEPGFLEVYAIGVDPWQCSLHPENPPLRFIEAREWVPRTAWHDWFPWGRTLDAQLSREITNAKKEKRLIAAHIA